MHHKLVVAMLVVLASATGCHRERAENTAENPVRVGTVHASAAVPRAPDQPVLSSAATPLGWTDELERRAAEEAYARGETETPHAIGGGPASQNE